MRRNLVIATKDSELYVVRFLKDHKRLKKRLKQCLILLSLIIQNVILI